MENNKPSKKPFYTRQVRDVKDALLPEQLSGSAKRDVQPTTRLTTPSSDGSQFREVITAQYDANNVDPWEVEQPFGVASLGRFPAAFVWYIGAVDALGALVGTRSLLIPGPNTSGAGVVGIYSSTAYAYCEDDKVIIGGTSVDTGHVPLVTAYFYVVVTADVPNSGIQGII